MPDARRTGGHITVDWMVGRRVTRRIGSSRRSPRIRRGGRPLRARRHPGDPARRAVNLAMRHVPGRVPEDGRRRARHCDGSFSVRSTAGQHAVILGASADRRSGRSSGDARSPCFSAAVLRPQAASLVCRKRRCLYLNWRDGGRAIRARSARLHAAKHESRPHPIRRPDLGATESV